MCVLQLHGGDAGSRGGSGHVLERHFGHPRLFDQSCKARLSHHEAVVPVDVEPPVERAGTGTRDDAAIRKVGPGCACLHGPQGIAVEGQPNPELARQHQQPWEQIGVTPIRDEDIRVVPAKEGIERG